jgi:hypothetical protein
VNTTALPDMRYDLVCLSLSHSPRRSPWLRAVELPPVAGGRLTSVAVCWVPHPECTPNKWGIVDLPPALDCYSISRKRGLLYKLEVPVAAWTKAVGCAARHVRIIALPCHAVIAEIVVTGAQPVLAAAWGHP